VIARFIGATPRSFEPAALVSGLDAEIARSYGAQRGSAPEGWNELVSTFRARLELASAERLLVLFLDALDQLITTREATFHPWFPRKPPPHVTVVASILPDATGGQSPDDIPDDVLERFRRAGAPLYFAGGQDVTGEVQRADPPALLGLGGLSAAEREAFLDASLDGPGRTLRDH
jgi:hypothetical protein